jgi:hypothetical protein
MAAVGSRRRDAGGGLKSPCHSSMKPIVPDKLENFKAAIGLYFGYYNLVKMHNTLRTTPAMAAGVVSELWTGADLVEKTDA